MGRSTQRNQHIAAIEKHGRIGWQRRSGYNPRIRVETAMNWRKTIIRRRLLARTLFSQQVAAKIGCNAEPDDKLRDASHHPDRLMPPPAGKARKAYKPPSSNPTSK
jgi:hypothetical protein